ncbi:MAG TPA: hypothetical protein V6C95_15295 [Coleofasciculaceae cyanobacterium]
MRSPISELEVGMVADSNPRKDDADVNGDRCVTTAQSSSLTPKTSQKLRFFK